MRTARTSEEAAALFLAVEKEGAELGALQAEARATRIGRALRDPEAYYARMVRMRTLDAELYYLSEVWGLDEEDDL